MDTYIYVICIYIPSYIFITSIIRIYKRVHDRINVILIIASIILIRDNLMRMYKQGKFVPSFVVYLRRIIRDTKVT